MSVKVTGYDSETRTIVELQAPGVSGALRKAHKALESFDDLVLVSVVKDDSHLFELTRGENGAIEIDGSGDDGTIPADVASKVSRKVRETFEVVLGGETYEVTRAELRTIVDIAKANGIRG